MLTKKIVKKRVKHFKRPQSDRKICVKVILCYDCFFLYTSFLGGF